VDIRRVDWQDRTHFFAMAARSMRRILVEFARSRLYQKRGGGAQQVTLDAALVVGTERGKDLVALDDALQALAQIYPRAGQVVELRFFGGLSLDQTAEVLKVSPATAQRDWKLAKVWLLRELKKS
jgi:RNA polymerase sigma factor (TIGR02999 family)